ncbi:uncharacterized protein KY384_003628 [Bacidia gigantensis]|uniref:uncharacterized protein n=1 Tax=Bacidia gigantensis TaxID=2732470 RepID=UPI001D04A49D|nr:uncharacterized protein KY384_003628 [Bacidia gigantensis]KAG8531992.1 hypothetical protein KY384_003628 [Bacidia gigantensis]
MFFFKQASSNQKNRLEFCHVSPLHVSYIKSVQATNTKMLKLWAPSFHKAHKKYIESGCLCEHEQTLESYWEPLHEIEKVHTVIAEQCLAVAGDLEVAEKTMHKAEHNFRKTAEILTDDLVEFVDQKHAVHGQMPMRKKLYNKVLNTFNGRKVSALPQLTGAVGAAYREHLELKQLEAAAAKKGQSSKDLKMKRDEVVRWRNVYVNLKDYNEELQVVKRRANITEAAIKHILQEEERWGREYYGSLKIEKTMNVAKDGLGPLICKQCDGWCWNDAKKPVFRFGVRVV